MSKPWPTTDDEVHRLCVEATNVAERLGHKADSAVHGGLRRDAARLLHGLLRAGARATAAVPARSGIWGGGHDAMPVAKGDSMKRLVMALIVVAMGAACAGQDVGSACVASCMTEEPEHGTECENACVAFDDDAGLATAEVKENCETGEPPPVPTGTMTWQCDGRAHAAQRDSPDVCDIVSVIYLGHGAYMSSYTTEQLACQRAIDMALATVNRRPGCGGVLGQCFNCTQQ